MNFFYSTYVESVRRRNNKKQNEARETYQNLSEEEKEKKCSVSLRTPLK